MNTDFSHHQARAKALVYFMIALAALMVIYWTINVSKFNPAGISGFNTPAQIVREESYSASRLPTPSPVPTPPAAPSLASAEPIPTLAAQPVAVPQPVPMPPVNP
jgi:hypothetical protein